MFGLLYEGKRINDHLGFIQIVYDRNNLGDKSVKLILSDDEDEIFIEVPLTIIPDPPTDDGKDDGTNENTDNGTNNG